MKYILTIFFLYNSLLVTAQDALQVEKIDNHYLEDQFYIGITYNLLINKPNNVSQNNFSNGIQLGFIKDFPINTTRNKAFGVGIGYAANSYFNNLQATENVGAITYEVIPADVQYKRNKIENHLVEIPLEYRWRTSTSKTYKFWRIYTGVKVGYVFAHTSKYITTSETIKFSNDDVNPFQYGLYISFGYNTWNFYTHYTISKLFKNDVFTTGGEPIDMQTLKIGLLFYIL